MIILLRGRGPQGWSSFGGATEDRVIGCLICGTRSVLARWFTSLPIGGGSSRTFMDEVNLLHDHLVDLLLDAAAMGRSTVERDGVSVAHAARLILIGTMNPEEGEPDHSCSTASG